jgi:DNA-directed RNA polymerase subunit beta
MNAISKAFTARKRIRKSFGRLPEVAPMPNLIDVQRASYATFLQMETHPDSRTNTGLQEVFKSVFPINDFAGRGRLEFVQYELEEPKYDVEECIARGLTYAAPLKVKLRLIVWDLDEDTGSRSVRDIKEQDVYMGDMPLMTDNGTFIINGTERVIVSQMHRSPGVFFDHDKGKTHSSGKYLFAARVIPYRGSWLDFEFDAKDICYVRVDRKRKLPASTLLLALDGAATEAKRLERAANGTEMEPGEIRGMDAEEILAAFYGRSSTSAAPRAGRATSTPTATATSSCSSRWWTPRPAPSWPRRTRSSPPPCPQDRRGRHHRGAGRPSRPAGPLRRRGHGEPGNGRALGRGRRRADRAEAGRHRGSRARPPADARHRPVGRPLDAQHAGRGQEHVPRRSADGHLPRDAPRRAADARDGRDAVPRPVLRPDRYDLSSVGRVKMNMRLGFSLEEAPDHLRTLRKQDVVATMRVLLELKDGRGSIDDIDNLGNRRVRSVGELMENQYRVGLLRMDRAIKERMGSVDIDTVMPHDLINAKPAAAAVREFFGSSQLSQFMDQTNPLSEVTHKRRLSALGPGGLTRERAASRCATCTRRITAASARSRRRKARTSA